MISGYPARLSRDRKRFDRGIGPKASIIGDIRREFCILPVAPLREPRANAARTRNRSREGWAMKDRDRRDSGRLMLISPERVFYAGLLGRPRERSSGGFNIYTAMQGSLKITEGKSEVVAEMALVRPYVPHSVESEHSSIICLVI